MSCIWLYNADFVRVLSLVGVVRRLDNVVKKDVAPKVLYDEVVKNNAQAQVVQSFVEVTMDSLGYQTTKEVFDNEELEMNFERKYDGSILKLKIGKTGVVALDTRKLKNEDAKEEILGALSKYGDLESDECIEHDHVHIHNDNRIKL